MAKAKFHAADGAFKNADYELPSSHFEQEISEAAMYLAVDAYLNNNRQGTHKTKNRAEVSGGGKKPWKQKGTGRARQGSNTAPQWARGGKAHGAKPHLYKVDMNKKVKRRALLSAFSVKAKEGAVYVFEKLALAAPKTKDLAKVLETAALDGQRNLVLVSEADRNLLLASRNIPDVQVQRVWDANTYELISAKNVIFTDAAVKALADGSAPAAKAATAEANLDLGPTRKGGKPARAKAAAPKAAKPASSRAPAAKAPKAAKKAEG